jgi:hypothetical protein
MNYQLVHQLSDIIQKLDYLCCTSNNAARIMKYDMCIEEAQEILNELLKYKSPYDDEDDPEFDFYRFRLTIRYNFLKIKIKMPVKNKRGFLFF